MKKTCLFLVVCMVLTILPTAAYASGSNDSRKWMIAGAMAEYPENNWGNVWPQDKFVMQIVPEASQGFAGRTRDHRLETVFPEELLARFPEEKRRAAVRILEEDPRPRYMPEERESYGIAFAGNDIHFRITGGTAVVFEVIPLDEMTERDKVTKKL